MVVWWSILEYFHENAYNEKYLVVNKKLLINCEHTRGDMLLYTFIFTLLLTTSSPELYYIYIKLVRIASVSHT